MFNAVSVQQTNSKKNNRSIIDMANAAYSITAPFTTTTTRTRSSQQQHSIDGAISTQGNIDIGNCNGKTVNSFDDRLDAARTMLGISPCSVTDDIMGGRGGRGGRGELGNSANKNSNLRQQQEQYQQATSSTMITNNTNVSSRRSRSNSAGLDALAFLATREQESLPTTSTMATVSILLEKSYELNSSDGRQGVHSNSQITRKNQATTTVAFPNPVTSSSDDDSEIMPPPPPRTLPICSDSNNNNRKMSRRRSVSNPEGMDKWGTKRLRLVLPACIIEEEIAEANAAIMIAQKEKSIAETVGESSSPSFIPNNNDESNNESLPTPVVDDEEEYLDHDQLLRRARSRLLEDLSQSSIVSGEKGGLTYPHSLKKYKEVYNKNGHIGIYTPAERAAIIARFQKKRKSRVWNKKIRYNCRKNLADRRLRIKGRFVKRSSPSSNSNGKKFTAIDIKKTCIVSGEGKTTTSAETAKTTTDFGTTSAIPEDTEFIVNNKSVTDTDTEMPDVTDPDAGFCPTDDQPYRRLRRHTIT
mmetsp:Transcript_26279/g.26708  ORF Transcript_26279/g.26708 Transcript_26279/m.26708 type:complete len:528 (+) Transcript_26279:137-1720(+)